MDRGAISTTGTYEGFSTEYFFEECFGRKPFVFHACICLNLARLQFDCFSSAGKESKMTDFHKAFRQNMHEKPADKFFRSQRHYFFPLSITVVPPAESNLSIIFRYNPVVRNSNSVRISAQIFNHTFSIAKRWFAVHYPFFRIAFRQQC